MVIASDALKMMAADSNCLSFIIDAFEGIERPVDPIAEQKIALARIFIYTGETFFTLRTIKSECDRIPDPIRRAKHHSWMLTHFGTLPVQATDEAIVARANYFEQFHRKRTRDCMILAEAEAARIGILLSFDDDFVERLAMKSNVLLIRPRDCWDLLDIPNDAQPKTVPHPTNPLVSHDWWRLH